MDQEVHVGHRSRPEDPIKTGNEVGAFEQKALNALFMEPCQDDFQLLERGLIG